MLRNHRRKFLKKFPFLTRRALILVLVLLSTTSVLVSAASTGTERVSVNSSGDEGNGVSNIHDVSEDGRYVTFVSGATNLVPGDTNGAGDVFVLDRQTGTVTRVSVSSTGVEGNDTSSFPAISADGRYVAFGSEATNLVPGDDNGVGDIFVHDRSTGTTTRVSVSSTGEQADGSSIFQGITADGNLIAFVSQATNLVADDTNGFQDIFLHNRSTGNTTRVSVSSTGVQANSNSNYPSISENECFVVFQSVASNLVSGDTNGVVDVFVHDCSTGATARVSVASDGTQANNHSSSFGDMDISGDGRYVSFYSNASNLVSDDTNGFSDVFVHDRNTGETTRVSVSSGGAEADSNSTTTSISFSGRHVIFQSDATNLVSDDTNGVGDVFIHDRQLGETTRVSVSSSGEQGNARSGYWLGTPRISSDGRYAVFASDATNLVSGDTNGVSDVFIHDTIAAAVTPSSLPETGFRHGEVSRLPHQTAAKAYTSTAMTLVIPGLGVSMDIVGVPQSGGEWDVSWLGNSAGYLSGSAFPTWAGNTVITGHVWDAYNRPGAFAGIKSLKYGDQVEIHAWGQTYTYEVRESKLITRNNVDGAFQSEQYDWVTLLTCEFYNPLSGEYLFRRAVRAVLVSVQ